MERQAENIAQGRNVDIDFDQMINKERLLSENSQKFSQATQFKLSVCVRKRPLFSKEVVNGEIDCLSICNP